MMVRKMNDWTAEITEKWEAVNKMLGYYDKNTTTYAIYYRLGKTLSQEGRGFRKSAGRTSPPYVDWGL
jgi:hypothetical protein